MSTPTLKVPELSEQSRARIESVLDRAATDISFRNELLASPERALQDSSLTPEEISALTNLRRVGLEEWGINIRKYRAFLRDNGNKISAISKK